MESEIIPPGKEFEGCLSEFAQKRKKNRNSRRRPDCNVNSQSSVESATPPADTGDENWWWELYRPIAIAAQCFGAFPVLNAFGPNSERLKFRWPSMQVVWSVFLLFTGCLSLCIIGVKNFELENGVEFIFNGSNAILAALLILMQLFNAKYLPDYVKKWRYIYNNSWGSLVTKVRLIAAAIYAVPIVLTATNIAAHFFSADKKSFLDNSIGIATQTFNTINITIIIASNLNFAVVFYGLRHCFRNIKDDFQKKMNLIVTQKVLMADFSDEIAKIRSKYNYCCHLVSITETIYGTALLVSVTILSLNSAFAVHIHATSVAGVWGSFGLAVSLALITILCISAHSISKEVASMAGVLIQAPIHDLTTNEISQLLVFLHQLQVAPPKISADGFFVISKQLLVVYYGIMVAYIFAIIQ